MLKNDTFIMRLISQPISYLSPLCSFSFRYDKFFGK